MIRVPVLDWLPDGLPYEFVGRVTVGVVLVLTAVLVIGAVVVIAVWLWVRGWRGLSELCWRGYEPDGQRPPSGRLQVSAVATALAHFKPWKIPAAVNEARELAGTNAAETMDE